MPYACSADGGRVTLSPSREEAYRIYGQREERPYTVCSPINPNACRTWLLHRFELDCGGTRVDWLSVVRSLRPSRPPGARGSRTAVCDAHEPVLGRRRSRHRT